MIKIALTGGIGSGKSTVARLLAERGAVVIDADQVAREVVEPGQPALAEIEQRFGRGVIRLDGTLDRAGLAAIVFADHVALADLNAITHPRIGERTAELIAAASSDAVVVYDLPLFVEQGGTGHWDRIVAVEAPLPLRLARLAADRGMTEAEARARIAAQATDEQRRAMADVVIVNDGDVGHLEREVDAFWRSLPH